MSVSIRKRLVLAMALLSALATPAVAAPPNGGLKVFGIGVRNSDTESIEFKNPGYGCAWLIVEVSSVTFSPSVQPFLRIVDTVLGNEYDVAFANALPITAQGIWFFFMGTEANPNPDPGNADFMTIVPPHRFKIFMDHANDNDINYEASVMFTSASCDP